MSKGNTTENAVLLLIFNGTAWADIAENDGTTPCTNFDVHLHTADPGEAGASTANEATYTSYAVKAVARTSGGWTVSGNSVSNAAEVLFDECTGGSNTITHASITRASDTVILYKTAAFTGVAVTTGVQPRFSIGDLTFTED